MFKKYLVRTIAAIACAVVIVVPYFLGQWIVSPLNPIEPHGLMQFFAYILGLAAVGMTVLISMVLWMICQGALVLIAKAFGVEEL